MRRRLPASAPHGSPACRRASGEARLRLRPLAFLAAALLVLAPAATWGSLPAAAQSGSRFGGADSNRENPGGATLAKLEPARTVPVPTPGTVRMGSAALPDRLLRQDSPSQAASAQEEASAQKASLQKAAQDTSDEAQAEIAKSAATSEEAEMVPVRAEEEEATRASSRRRKETRPKSGEELAVLKARAAYRQTGDARIIRRGTKLVLPYGHIQPTIKTSTFRFTLIELAGGEYVKKPFIADPVRWAVDYGTTGVPGDFTQYVAVKPERCGLATNMAFLTNQGRVYNLTLKSAPCSGKGELLEANLGNGSGTPYAVHVGFYYPDEAAAQAPAPPAQARASAPPPTVIAPEELAARRPSAAPSASRRVRGLNPGLRARQQLRQRAATAERHARMPSVSLDELNTAYQIEAEDGFPCVPVSVSDDGHRMFVRFPAGRSGGGGGGGQCGERFPLYAEGPDEKLRLINYTVLDGNLYVTEGVPKKAVLLYQGAGTDDRHLVRIRNRRLAK